MIGLFKAYFKDSARPYNEILASCFGNSSSSYSPTANYYFKGLIHLKTIVPFFLGRAKPAITVSQTLLAEE